MSKYCVILLVVLSCYMALVVAQEDKEKSPVKSALKSSVAPNTEKKAGDDLQTAAGGYGFDFYGGGLGFGWPGYGAVGWGWPGYAVSYGWPGFGYPYYR